MQIVHWRQFCTKCQSKEEMSVSSAYWKNPPWGGKQHHWNTGANKIHQ